MNPDRLAELEEERRFLLRSLTDLEKERAVGDVDEADFQALRDGYTARAATVLRAIHDGRSALPPKRPRRLGRLGAIVASVLAVAALAGWAVARSSGQRLDGDSITGGNSPDQIDVMLSRARQQLGVDNSAASNGYLAVLKIEPKNAEARTYTGWLIAISSEGQSGADAKISLQTAKDYMHQVTVDDPTYPDAFCLLAVILGRFELDAAAAKVQAQQCLDNNPPADMRNLIEPFVKSLDPSATVTS